MAIIIVPLSILLTWLYNRTGGNLFLMVCLHTAFNLSGSFVPASGLPAAVLGLGFVVAIVVVDRMYSRKAESTR